VRADIDSDFNALRVSSPGAKHTCRFESTVLTRNVARAVEYTIAGDHIPKDRRAPDGATFAVEHAKGNESIQRATRSARKNGVSNRAYALDD